MNLDLGFLYNMNEGPLRSGLIVLGVALLAMLLAIFLHRMGIALVRRLARGHPFTTTATTVTFNASRACVMLFMLRLVLAGAPDNTPGLTRISYLTSVAFILALTWFLMRCVKSVSLTVINLNPYDVADNLKARRILTQTRVLSRSAYFIIALLGLAFVLLTLPGARQFGASLLASAGVAGIVAGIAAKPVLGNFFAGLQIAFSQPIRIDDVLIVKGEWGRVEEITGTFVVVRIWDERRMIVPLQWFIENPFENWTHTSSTILGTVFLWLDFSVPTAAIRAEFERVCQTLPLWDGRVCVMHVTDASERAMQVRLLVSARDSGSAFDLRCQIREHMISFIATHYPDALPRLRADVSARNQPDALDTVIDGPPGEKTAD
ncbi:mechanosensitive ion channel protein [Herbaspirillum rubrisubalbicans M1]|uniref:mechanosensitive ion channel family protein n=1 Tax=Herbaspirillum rubrisubalbicans TaxID=80842 RepID=UPI00073A22AB|nr:mechanosensitive ion channel domain-containing protein [Herbaspirillum rubrisubalbicans]ALU87288.1 mechanosensitive ion channel protein [Herbaspirillum rubrisubalbicans M1]